MTYMYSYNINVHTLVVYGNYKCNTLHYYDLGLKS